MREQNHSTQSRRDIRRSKRRAEREEKKRENQVRRKRGREVYIAGYLMIGIFFCMIVYFMAFEISGKNEVLVNPLNNRTRNMAQSVTKGDVVTSDNAVAATTQIAEDGSEIRVYPYENLFAHTIGYATKGGSGLEGSQKIRLLTSHNSFLELLKQEVLNQKPKGDTLSVTLHSALQYYCYEQLGGRNGAIVVMEPKTGRILAMVSYPDFNPSTVDDMWEALISPDNTTGNLMNRASQGRYAPGSTFKIITLLEYIRENPDTWQDFSYFCNGTYTDGERSIGCHEGHAHGELDIYGALAQSCNGAFVTMGLSLDPVKWKELCEDFGYNQKYSLDIQYNMSKFPMEEDASDWDLMQASIGQGTVEATPLLDTMVTCAVANGGKMMKPYLIEKYESQDGSYQDITEPELLQRSISEEEASLLTEFMVNVVKEGTGAGAQSSYCQVAGKTGSAQFSSQAGRYHAWFTGFAPAEDPEIAVTVLIEDGGSGGEVAAPIAGNIFNYYFSLQQQEE